MSLFDGVLLPDSKDVETVCRYLEAQHQKDFRAAKEFFAEDVYFNGLVLKQQGCDAVAAAMEQFTRAVIEDLRIEAIAEVESGETCRILALYFFKLKGKSEYQAIVDHIMLENRKIVRIDNAFDARKAQP